MQVITFQNDTYFKIIYNAYIYVITFLESNTKININNHSYPFTQYS